MAITKVIVIQTDTQKAQKQLDKINLTIEQQEDLLKDIQRQIEKLEDIRGKTSKKDANRLKEINQEIKNQNKNLKRTKTRLTENKQARTKDNKALKDSVKNQRDYSGVLGVIDRQTGGAISGFQGMITGITGATKGFKLMRVAIIATGIGALVVAIMAVATALTNSEAGQNKFSKMMTQIGVVIGNVTDILGNFGNAIMSFVTGNFDDAFESINKVTEGIKNFGEETKKEIALAGQLADKRAEADKIDRELLLERAEANRKFNELREKAADKENVSIGDRIAALKEAGRIDEEITIKEIAAAKLRFEAKKLENSLSASTKEDLDEQVQLEAALINLETARLKKSKTLTAEITTNLREAESERKAIVAKKTADEKAADAIANAEIARLKKVQAFKDGLIVKDEDNRYKAAEKLKSDRLVALEALKLSKTEEQEMIVAIEQSFKDQKEIIDDQAKIVEDEEKAALLEKFNEDEILKLEQQQEKDLAELERLGGNEEEKNKIIAFYAKKTKKLEDKADKDKEKSDKAVGKAKIDIAMRSMALIGEIAGKGSAIGKAMAVGQTTISGIEGVQNAFTTANESPITAGFPAYPFIQASLAGVFSALQIRKILSTKADGKGATPSPIVSGGGAPQVAPPPPSFNTVGTSGTNQLAEAIGGQAPARAYVVSGDITTAQGLERNTIEGATI